MAADHYEVIYAARPDCEGQHVCSYGTVRGSAKAVAVDSAADDRKPLRVHLVRGIHANYFPFSCGSYCGEAEVCWDEGAYTYSISIKAGRLKELKQLANSALRHSAR